MPHPIHDEIIESILAKEKRFEAPLWARVLLIAGFACSVANMVDLWTTRRQLDAVIARLQQQANDNRKMVD
jgi:hypothetical protein